MKHHVESLTSLLAAAVPRSGQWDSQKQSGTSRTKGNTWYVTALLLVVGHTGVAVGTAPWLTQFQCSLNCNFKT